MRPATRQPSVPRALLALCALFGAAAACHAQEGPPTLQNVVERDGVYTLRPGPNVEGVVLVRQGAWPEDVIRVFHEGPWLDAASVRLPWAVLEPSDQEFSWAPFDRLLAEVKAYNAGHPGARRTLHIRVMAGEHCPAWFEGAGVRFYDTVHRLGPGQGEAPIRVPVPYENPQFLKQLREVYRAMYERYKDEPLVAVYHGTWSAGPWDEIFHPQWGAPLPLGYTPEKFVQGMVEQLDVLIEEFCLKGKVAELPYSGKYPQKDQIDITGPLTARIVERLGRRSPFLYIQSNGWGRTNKGTHSICWRHELDVYEAYGKVNLALQALGTNAGGGWMPQGDWLELVSLAERFDAAYVELYPPDFMPLDTRHHIVEAFTGEGALGGLVPKASPEGFVGFRPWLNRRRRTLYVRDCTARLTFTCGEQPRPIGRIITAAVTPPGTAAEFRARTRLGAGPWSPWEEAADVRRLPSGTEAEVEARLHTDDGCLTPAVALVYPACEMPWGEPTWQPASPGTGTAGR